MKSYTDIEQSKKLVEILPLESADMYYFLDPTPVGNIYIPSLIIIEKHLKSRMPEYDKGDIPCWSLAALLDVILQELFDGEYIINITEGCDNKWILTYDRYENRNHSFYGLSTCADNLVNACYEMIIKLHELNLL